MYLKNCPFCGEIPVLRTDEIYNESAVLCICAYFKVQPFTRWMKSKEESIGIWNNRAKIDVVEQVSECNI